MRVIENLKRQPVFLLLSGVVLISLAILWKSFPILIFLAFAPPLAALDTLQKPRLAPHLLFVSILSITFLAMFQTWGPVGSVIFYVLLAILLASVYLKLNDLTEGKFEKGLLIVFYLGIEYVMLKLLLKKDVFFLADILKQTDWVRWNHYTGYLGATAWIIFTNLLFYQVIFKSESFSYLKIILAVSMILIPIMYSYNLTSNAVTKDELIHLYSGINASASDPYPRHGELISRTGAWVSFLIIIFTLIRAKTSRRAR